MKNIDYDFLGRVLEAIHPGITIADRDGKFVFVGDFFEREFGVDPQKILSINARDKEIEKIFSPCVTAMVMDRGEKIITTQSAPDGSKCFVSGVPVYDQNGELSMIISFSSWEVLDYNDLKANYEKLIADNNLLRNEINRLVNKDYINQKLISTSKQYKACARLINIFAESNVPSFIYGDAGVGKTYIAHTAYDLFGNVYDYSFELLSTENIDKELFGNDERLGILNTYDTVIIHSIDKLPPEIQKKLVVSVKNENCANICGLARDSLDELKKGGKIIDELYYYFKTYEVEIPPLNKRPDDLKAYIEYFLELFNKKYDKTVSFLPRAFNQLLSYEWKDNINEIKYTIERIVLTSEKPKVDVFDLPAKFTENSIKNFEELTSLKDMLEFYEGNIINRAYEKYNTTVALAKELGISQASAVRKIKKYVKK